MLLGVNFIRSPTLQPVQHPIISQSLAFSKDLAPLNSTNFLNSFSVKVTNDVFSVSNRNFLDIKLSCIFIPSYLSLTATVLFCLFYFSIDYFSIVLSYLCLVTLCTLYDA